MGDIPDPNRCPPDIGDFPEDAQKALLAYGKFGDRIASDIGYLGKDLSTLELFMDLYKIENRDIFVETILLLDQGMIEKSAEAIKRERDKMKK